MRDSYAVTGRQKVLAVVVAILLIVGGSVYSQRHNPYAAAPTPTNTLELTNPLVLQNWLTPDVYKYTVARLRDYARTQKIDATSATVASDVTIQQGAYTFAVIFNPDGNKHIVNVYVNNFSGVVSTAVSVDGVKQNIALANNSDTEFDGIDTLIDDGLTSVQANNLEAAFLKFRPGADSVVIDTDSIVGSTYNPNNPGQLLFTFSVSVDSDNYTAVVDHSDFSSVQLTLKDADSGRQVFNSGVVDSNN